MSDWNRIGCLWVDATGIREERDGLTQVGPVFKLRWPSSKGAEQSAVYQCDCGSFAVLKVRDVRRGHSKTCGHANAILTRRGSTSGRMKEATEHIIWRSMRARCLNPKHKSYSYYGGRGITMCDRWQQSYASFLEDVGRRPSPQHSIDRIDNDGNYEPGNVRWATFGQQSTNKRKRQKISWIAKLSRITGINLKTLQTRYYAGWDIEKMVYTEPMNPLHNLMQGDREPINAHG